MFFGKGRALTILIYGIARCILRLFEARVGAWGELGVESVSSLPVRFLVGSGTANSMSLALISGSLDWGVRLKGAVSLKLSAPLRLLDSIVRPGCIAAVQVG